MEGLWLHFTRFFQAPAGVAALESCRVVEALVPLANLYGVDFHGLPPLSYQHQQETE